MFQSIAGRSHLVSTAPAIRARAIVPGPQLAVIIPTRNEHDNVRPVYHALCRTLQGIDWPLMMPRRMERGRPSPSELAATVGRDASSGSAGVGLRLLALRESWQALHPSLP